MSDSDQPAELPQLVEPSLEHRVALPCSVRVIQPSQPSCFSSSVGRALSRTQSPLPCYVLANECTRVCITAALLYIYIFHPWHLIVGKVIELRNSLLHKHRISSCTIMMYNMHYMYMTPPVRRSNFTHCCTSQTSKKGSLKRRFQSPRYMDLIETESETWKSQMYGHNAGQPVSSLCTKYYLT